MEQGQYKDPPTNVDPMPAASRPYLIGVAGGSYPFYQLDQVVARTHTPPCENHEWENDPMVKGWRKYAIHEWLKKHPW